MDCPYCKNRMRMGSLSSGRNGIYFIPQNQRKKLFILPERIKVQGTFDSRAVVKYCEECKKLIIDI